MQKTPNSYFYYLSVSTFFLLLIWMVGIALSNISPLLYEEALAQEDGPIENLTNLFLCGAIILMVAKTVKSPKKALYFSAILGLVFILGEEISWGQRMLNLDVADSLQHLNSQKELNFHNLKPAGFSINKWVFGKGLTAVIFLYLFCSHWMSQSSTSMGRFMREHQVPVASPRQALITTFLILGLIFVNSGEKWELYELTCVVTFCNILLKDLLETKPEKAAIPLIPKTIDIKEVVVPSRVAS